MKRFSQELRRNSFSVLSVPRLPISSSSKRYRKIPLVANGREIVTIILRGRLKIDQKSHELRKVGVKARYRSRVGLACRAVVKGVYHLYQGLQGRHICVKNSIPPLVEEKLDLTKRGTGRKDSREKPSRPSTWRQPRPLPSNSHFSALPLLSHGDRSIERGFFLFFFLS